MQKLHHGLNQPRLSTTTPAAGMAKSAEQRRTQALDVAQGLAFSLIIVGVS